MKTKKPILRFQVKIYFVCIDACYVLATMSVSFLTNFDGGTAECGFRICADPGAARG